MLHAPLPDAAGGHTIASEQEQNEPAPSQTGAPNDGQDAVPAPTGAPEDGQDAATPAPTGTPMGGQDAAAPAPTGTPDGEQNDTETEKVELKDDLQAAAQIGNAEKANAQNGRESQFVDRNRMSDDEFFGVWHEEEGVWDPEPKLDYSYAQELGLVEEYVKMGDLYNAKECLLHYYQNRPLKIEIPTGRNSLESRISMEGIHTFESPAVALLSVGTKPAEYSANVTSLVKSNVSCFLIQSLKRESLVNGEEEIVSFHSKESKDHPPVLEVYQGTDVTRLEVDQDMYIRGGDFAGENYGTEDRLLVSEGGAIPVDNGTRQTHIRFDLSKLDLNKPITRATLKLYGESTVANKEVVVFSGVESSWEESIITYSNLPIRVMSWNNCPEGYDWAQRSGLHAQFYNVQIRLLHVPRMFAEYFANKDERYALAAINQYLDFIGDNGGLLYDTYTKEAALNAAFRGDPYASSAFAGALACDGIIDGTAATSMLKFIWQEATGLTLPKNEWRKHNGQAFQIDSLLRYIAYFPEFKDRNQWITNIDRRVMELAEDLLYADGGYLESTSGYDSGVLSTFTGLFDLAEVAGIDLPAEFMDIYRKFATAEMNLTMPNGVQWGWGDGGPVQMRPRIQAVADITGDQEMAYFATIGSDKQEGTLPSYTSYFLPESKLAVMRNNWSENGVSAFLRGRSGGGHSHADVNHMSLYAYGRYLLADTGMSSYDQRDPNYQWQFLRTESHNTVEVNGTGQQKSGVVNTMMYTNPRVDFYTGESHAYLDFTHTRKVTFPKNSKFFIVSDFIQAPDNGSVNRFNQTWHNLVEAKPVLNEENKIAKTTYTSGANLEIVPVDPESLTSATLDDGVGLSSSNSVRNTSPKKHVSYKIEKAGNAKFNTVIYPFEGSANTEIPTTPLAVSDSADESASAFSMILPDGIKAIYYVNFKPEKIRRFDWYDVDAENVYMEFNNKDAIKFFSGSNINFMKQNGENLMSSSKKLSDISVSFEGKVAKIQSTQKIDLSKDYIRVYAPDVVKASFNDEDVPFVRIGDDVVIGRYHLEMTPKKDAGNIYSADISEDVSVSYPISASGKKYWATVEIAKGTKISTDKEWNGILYFDPMKDTSYQAGDTTFGLIPFDHYETDIPVRITFEGNPDWRAGMIAGGSVVEPETKIDQNTFEAAADAISAGKPVYYTSNNMSATYCSGLQSYVIYTTEPLPQKPGGGGNGGGGGGGGGHLWPDDPTPTPPVDPSPGPEVDPDEDVFEDIKGHWAEKDILAMHKLGFVNGVGENRFMPDGPVTRAEFVSIITRMLELTASPYEGLFEDVPESAWYAEAVETAAKLGIVNGTGDGFSPENKISRSEMAAMLQRTWAYLELGEVPESDAVAWTDAEAFAAWEQEAIDFVVSAGLMNGLPDGSFANRSSATRAEAATVLKRLYDKMDKGE